jgi:hypothetical protein
MSNIQPTINGCNKYLESLRFIEDFEEKNRVFAGMFPQVSEMCASIDFATFVRKKVEQMILI